MPLKSSYEEVSRPRFKSPDAAMDAMIDELADSKPNLPISSWQAIWIKWDEQPEATRLRILPKQLLKELLINIKESGGVSGVFAERATRDAAKAEQQRNNQLAITFPNRVSAVPLKL